LDRADIWQQGQYLCSEGISAAGHAMSRAAVGSKVRETIGAAENDEPECVSRSRRMEIDVIAAVT
jgi:hypothetical protein